METTVTINKGDTVTINKGDRVRLISTTDRYTKLLHGDLGTVRRIDDFGTVHINWDCGSRLGLVPGEDSWVIL